MQSINNITFRSSKGLFYKHKDFQVTYEDVQVLLQACKQMNAFQGARVVVFLPDGPNALIAHMLSFFSNLTVIPVSILTLSERLEYLLKQVQPNAILTVSQIEKKYSRQLQEHPVALMESGSGISFQMNLQNLIKKLTTILAENKFSRPIKPNPVSYLVFTTGSTGVPKGVCLSFLNVIEAAKQNSYSLGLNSKRKSLVTVPFYDYYGFIQVYSHLLASASLVTGENILFQKSFFEALAKGVTDLVTIPYTLKQVLDRAEQHRHHSLQHLKYVTSSSDVLDRTTLQRLFSVNDRIVVYNIYGLTEAARAAYNKICIDNIHVESLGKTSVSTELFLRNIENDTSFGEIVIKGPSVMLGYLQCFDNGHPVVKLYSEMSTGDVGKLNHSGEIDLVGRIDHIINVKGNKIHPLEIEKVALQYKDVNEARASYDHKSQAMLLEVLSSDVELDIDGLYQYLKRELSPSFVPDKIISVKEFERTELGSKMIRQNFLRND